MNPFVEECRQVWRRLGVPDPVANEMAADLAADVQEAEEEGGTLEDVLGNSAFDAPGFAASWAAARGVSAPGATASGLIPPALAAPLPGLERRRRPPMSVVLTALIGVLAMAGGVALGSGRSASAFSVVARRIAVGPGPLSLVEPGPFRLDMPPGAWVVRPGVMAMSNGLHALGLVLFLVGLAALGLALWYWSPWSARRSRRRSEGSSASWS